MVFDALFGPKNSKKRLFGANRDQIGTNFCKMVSIETFCLKRDHSGSSAIAYTYICMCSIDLDHGINLKSISSSINE